MLYEVITFHGQSAVMMVGDTVALTVLRDGRRQKLSLAISAESYERQAGERVDRRLAGVELQNFRAEDDPSRNNFV